MEFECSIKIPLTVEWFGKYDTSNKIERIYYVDSKRSIFGDGRIKFQEKILLKSDKRLIYHPTLKLWFPITQTECQETEIEPFFPLNANFTLIKFRHVLFKNDLYRVCLEEHTTHYGLDYFACVEYEYNNYSEAKLFEMLDLFVKYFDYAYVKASFLINCNLQELRNQGPRSLATLKEINDVTPERSIKYKIDGHRAMVVSTSLRCFSTTVQPQQSTQKFLNDYAGIIFQMELCNNLEIVTDVLGCHGFRPHSLDVLAFFNDVAGSYETLFNLTATQMYNQYKFVLKKHNCIDNGEYQLYVDGHLIIDRNADYKFKYPSFDARYFKGGWYLDLTEPPYLYDIEQADLRNLFQLHYDPNVILLDQIIYEFVFFGDNVFYLSRARDDKLRTTGLERFLEEIVYNKVWYQIPYTP